MQATPYKIITTLKHNNGNIYQTAKQLGISRMTIYRWIKRATTSYGYISSRNLRRKSRKPHTIYHALTVREQDAISILRKEKGYCADKIKKKLNLSVSTKTIHRFLKRKRLLRDYGYHRRPKFQNTIHMHIRNTKTIGYLQMDVKYVTPELSGLPWTCFEYAVLDIYSRYKEAIILNHLDEDGAIKAFMLIRKKLPFAPICIQTDNGLEFQKRFHEYINQLGIKHHYIHKRTPNENAAVERSFRTDEEEFFFRLPRRPKHYDELTVWFKDYLHEYNHKRPHLGIDLNTPYEIVTKVMSH